ncbi:MAG TPA: excinuclease ABC subunit UvrA [Thermoanaerobaculia bacterium]|nr:excinuclease ABC subunit UvrA [Thermoanaerobaculia bacterium]
MRTITIRGARANNLKGFDLSLPKNKVIVATGVSGSGKSSLVFDILFEEGRRQYLRSLGLLVGLDDEQDFDTITGLAPTIAVQQSIIRQSNPRSTVGSRTQILGLLAVLYAAEGRITCSSCGTPVAQDLTCPACGNTEERLSTRSFSYNAPDGMCIKCSGRGGYHEIDLDRLVPDDRTTLGEVFESAGMTAGYARLLRRHFGDHLDTPFSRLPDEVREEAIHGHYTDGNSLKRSYCLTRIFEGRLLKHGHDPSGIYTPTACSDCHGFRVGEEARRVLLDGRHIGELATMTLAEARAFLERVAAAGSLTLFGSNLIEEINRRMAALIASRLGHLSLYREMPTLSGGEVQRLFLSSHLDSGMDSLIYILDEPTVGLHESEKEELLRSVTALKELGNTVIVVEHDRNTIEMADHVVDIGPGAGVDGGRVVYQGDLAGLLACDDSTTGRYLSGRARMPLRRLDRGIVGSERGRGPTLKSATPRLTLRNARTHNLKDVTVSIPLGVLVGVAGVSGSGKSSLISNTLVPLLSAHFRDQADLGAARWDDDADVDEAPALVQTVANRLEGMELLAGFAEVSQAPIGRNLNSNPATYIGIWDRIRALFARQPEALERGLSAGHFSFNSEGACPACGGSGRVITLLGGTLKLYSRCRECDGKRFNDEALSVRYQGRTIVDVLEMRVSEAVAFFAGNRSILATLEVMERIGMGYIGLGQPTPSLSGGESQRIKLAREIGRRRKANILYLLDEPTTGLSLYDTAKLIDLLDELVRAGNSAIVVEHDPAVLASCDWLIELGPEGGAGGGRIIAEGTPDSLRSNPDSVTAKYLPVRA